MMTTLMTVTQMITATPQMTQTQMLKSYRSSGLMMRAMTMTMRTWKMSISNSPPDSEGAKY